MVWFAETWNMQDIRAVWPCLVKPDSRPIAILVVGAIQHAFKALIIRQQNLNKLFTTSWPLQLFVQLTAFWAHAHNVLLQPTHVPGRNNDWADDVGWPDSAIHLKVAYTSALQALHCQAEAFSCVRLMPLAPGTSGSCLQ